MEMLAYTNQNPTDQFNHLLRIGMLGMSEEQTQFCLQNNALRIRCASTGNEFVTYSMGEAGRFFRGHRRSRALAVEL